MGRFVRTSLGFPDDGSMQKERRKKKEGDLEWASLFVTRVFAFLAHGVAGCVCGGGVRRSGTSTVRTLRGKIKFVTACATVGLWGVDAGVGGWRGAPLMFCGMICFHSWAV